MSLLQTLLQIISSCIVIGFLRTPTTVVAAPIALFEDVQFRGIHSTFQIGESVCVNLVGKMNDFYSSVDTMGACFLVCEHQNCRGRCEEVTGKLNDLSVIGLNDLASSIKQCPPPVQSPNSNHTNHTGVGIHRRSITPSYYTTSSESSSLPINGASRKLSQATKKSSIRATNRILSSTAAAMPSSSLSTTAQPTSTSTTIIHHAVVSASATPSVDPLARIRKNGNSTDDSLFSYLPTTTRRRRSEGGSRRINNHVITVKPYQRNNYVYRRSTQHRRESYTRIPQPMYNRRKRRRLLIQQQQSIIIQKQHAVRKRSK